MRIHASDLWAKGVLLSIGFLIFSAVSFAQQDFNMQEKQMVEKFKRANSPFLEGLKNFEKGNLKKAAQLFKKCISLFPEHASAHFYLAQIDYQANAQDAALQNIETAIKNYKVMARFEISQREYLMKMLRDNRQELEEQKAKLEAELATFQSGGSTTKLEMERGISAVQNQISQLDNQLNQERRPPVIVVPASYFYVKGNICFKLKKYDDSVWFYQEALASDPQHAGAYNNLANLFYMLQNHEEALNTITAAESNGVTINQNLKDAIHKALGR